MSDGNAEYEIGYDKGYEAGRGLLRGRAMTNPTDSPTDAMCVCGPLEPPSADCPYHGPYPELDMPLPAKQESIPADVERVVAEILTWQPGEAIPTPTFKTDDLVALAATYREKAAEVERLKGVKGENEKIGSHVSYD